MANIIALIWDCDKTLIDGYMQDPLFRKFGIDSHTFWGQVNNIPVETGGIRHDFNLVSLKLLSFHCSLY